MLLTLAAAAGIGLWLAVTAIYRSDDYFLLAEAWSGGSLWDSLSHWCTLHLQPRELDRWPKFYRPVWQALFLVDTHVLGSHAALSALLSFGMHCATAWVAGRIVLHLTRSTNARWATTWLCLLPAAALQAVVWIAARGTVAAALCTMLGIAVAIAAQWPARLRLAAIALLVMLAAGSNEVGIMAGPVIVWAVLVAPHANDRPPRRLAIAITALLSTAVWVLWRRWILGCWVGGYREVAEIGSLWRRAASTVTSGTGAIALASDGSVALHTVRWVGLGVLLLLAGFALAGRRWGGGTRSLALLALGLLVAMLAPFVGAEFGSCDGTGGRYLYPSHIGCSLGIGAILAGTGAAGTRRRLAHACACLVVLGATVGFALAMRRFDRTLQVSRAVFEAAATIDAQHPVALLDLPDREGPFLVARNAFPGALMPPFRQAPSGVLGHVTDAELAAGQIQGLAAALPRLPSLPVWRWDAESRRLARGAWPVAVRWRGVITVGETGQLACGGIRLAAVPADIAAALVPGSWFELSGETRVVGDRPELHVLAAAPWQPRLQPERDPADGGVRWQYLGRRGDYLFLLAGSEPWAVGLGVAGSLGIAHPTFLPIGRVDDNGRLSGQLPPDSANATRVQAVVANGLDVVFGEVWEVR